MGCYLKCGNESIIVTWTGNVSCIAHGSIYDAEVCPKDKKKYKFGNNCLISR